MARQQGVAAGAFVTLCLLFITAADASRTGGFGAPFGAAVQQLAAASSPLTSWLAGARQQPAQQQPLQQRGDCDDPAYRKRLLTYIKEMPFIGLFADIRGTTKFEASGMTIAPGPDGEAVCYIVFDNLHALGRVDEQFEFRDPRNALVGPLGEDSQFEGLTYSEKKDMFYAVEEVYDDADHGFHPFVHEIKITPDHKSYKTVARCPVHFVLTHENKGLEGLHLHEHDGHSFLLGLCEGNFCIGGSQGREPGNGRIVVAQHNEKQGDECGWDVVKTVSIPSSAYFTDYSGIAFRGDKVAIISQEDSALWLGSFDFEAMEFTSEGTMYHFPRDNHCEIKYCNVEGIQWLDDVRFVIASDKAKSKQPFNCVDHEQRISIFSLPETA